MTHHLSVVAVEPRHERRPLWHVLGPIRVSNEGVTSRRDEKRSKDLVHAAAFRGAAARWP